MVNWYMLFTPRITGEYPLCITRHPIYLAFTVDVPSGYGPITGWYFPETTTCALNPIDDLIQYGVFGVDIEGNTVFTTPPILYENGVSACYTGAEFRVVFIKTTTSAYIINTRYNTFEFYGEYIFKNTPIRPCCFSEGTKILSLTSKLKEEYRLVQDLMIGDFVKSYLHGYRKVSRVISGSFINNSNEEEGSDCMYKMIKTDDNGLIENLTLTRNHGVLVEKLTQNEEVKVDKNNLLVIDNLLSIITADSDKFEKVLDTNVYKYYHFSLDSDGDEDRRFGVYANGVLVEVPSNNMMDNVLNVKPLDF